MSAWRRLIIRTGGNQRFIFGSNKRRLNVGASRLVTLLPVWVDAATARKADHVEKVTVVSCVAQIRVDDADVARDIVEAVTRHKRDGHSLDARLDAFASRSREQSGYKHAENLTSVAHQFL